MEVQIGFETILTGAESGRTLKIIGKELETTETRDVSGGVRTHASRETAALMQRLGPLGHGHISRAPLFFLSIPFDCSCSQHRQKSKVTDKKVPGPGVDPGSSEPQSEILPLNYPGNSRETPLQKCMLF